MNLAKAISAEPTESALRLQEFGVAFGDQIVLANVQLAFKPCSMNVLLGPAGSGKSTLLRTLVGANNAQPSLKTWGEILVDDARYTTEKPSTQLALVMQDARFLTSKVREILVACLPNRSNLQPFEQTEHIVALLEHFGLKALTSQLQHDVIDFSVKTQRQLAIVRAMAQHPSVLLVDEATANLNETEADEIIALLQQCATESTVVFVTHHQRHARKIGGTATLIAGGRVLEHQPTADFFASPTCPEAQCFVRTGSCQVPSPTAKAEELAEDVPLPPPLPKAAQLVANSHYNGPRGFFWLKPDLLGGCPRPGIFQEPEDDLAALKRVGVRVLITLEETPTVPSDALDACGIQNIFFPIDDMEAPDLDAAKILCSKVSVLNEQGQAVAFHCRAGLGRTGTLLTAMLIFDGLPASEAIDQARTINPKWIQSQVQVDFLTDFEHALQA